MPTRRLSLAPTPLFLLLLLGSMPASAGDNCGDFCTGNPFCDKPGFVCFVADCRDDEEQFESRCMPTKHAKALVDIEDGEVEEIVPEEQELDPGTGSGGGGGGGGGGLLSKSADLGAAPAKLLTGSFLGELKHKFLQLDAEGRTSALFSNLPELDGLLAVRAHRGTSMCYHLEATNNQAQPADFFVSLEMPTAIGVADPYDLLAAFGIRLVDTSGDGTVTITELKQTIDAATAGDVVSFIGLISETDIVRTSGTYDPGSVSFAAGPAAGPAPFSDPFARVGFFTSFTLSAGDTIVLMGAIGVELPEDASRCTVPAVRESAGTIFFDNFQSGDTTKWSAAVPVPPSSP